MKTQLMFGMLMNGSAIGLGLHRREEFTQPRKDRVALMIAPFWAPCTLTRPVEKQ